MDTAIAKGKEYQYYQWEPNGPEQAGVYKESGGYFLRADFNLIQRIQINAGDFILRDAGGNYFRETFQDFTKKYNKLEADGKQIDLILGVVVKDPSAVQTPAQQATQTAAKITGKAPTAPIIPAPEVWKQYFTLREMKQIRFSQIYFNEFFHGADGHNAMMIIAKLVGLLEGTPPPVPQEQSAVQQKS